MYSQLVNALTIVTIFCYNKVVNTSLTNSITCCFIGHRTVQITDELIDELLSTITELITERGVSAFIFGSRSQFNSLCLKIVSKIKEQFPHVERIAYCCKGEEPILESEKKTVTKAYEAANVNDEILCVDREYEHKTKYTAGRASYVERNQAMIDDSDFCIFYYREDYSPKERRTSKRSIPYQPKSGTRLAYEYACQKGKTIINVADVKTLGKD